MAYIYIYMYPRHNSAPDALQTAPIVYMDLLRDNTIQACAHRETAFEFVFSFDKQHGKQEGKGVAERYPELKSYHNYNIAEIAHNILNKNNTLYRAAGNQTGFDMDRF